MAFHKERMKIPLIIRRGIKISSGYKYWQNRNPAKLSYFSPLIFIFSFQKFWPHLIFNVQYGCFSIKPVNALISRTQFPQNILRLETSESLHNQD